jgi:hypothetical protein
MSQEHDWFSSPSLGQRTGVIGFSQGLTSTGRLSDLIKVAAKNGLIELAKTKNIKIENDSEVKLNNDGYYSLFSKSEHKTDAIVSAFMADIKMEINSNAQPSISIWLLEN